MEIKSKPKTKRCQVCGKEFPKCRGKVCSSECFVELIKIKKAQKEHKMLLRRIENENYKKLKEKAWKIFSKWIRKRTADKYGNVKCVTCGDIKHYKEMQAGHAISGRGGYVLFNEKIVRPQCYGCNMCAGGRYDAFVVYLTQEEKSLTIEEYAEIKRKSLLPCKLSKQELEEIIEKYSTKLKELENDTN